MANKSKLRKFRMKLWCAMQNLMLDVKIHESGWHEPLKSYMRYSWRREKRYYKNKKWNLYQKEA